jgi:DHA2 family multidrug resistance protein
MSTVSVTPQAAANSPAEQPVRAKVFAFVLMCVGFFMATLDIQIVASSLKDIGGGLSASQDEISWVQTSYLIAEIIAIPMSGWLSRVFSTRWLFAASAFGFTVVSMMCGLAWDIDSMILFRALQGALGAAMIPTVFTTVFVLFPPGKQRLIASTAVSTLASLAPTVGPVIGGWLTGEWSWHWLFFINLVPGVLVTVLVPKFVHVDEADLSLLKRGDYVGIVLMSAFLGCLEYVLEEGPRKNWFGDDAILACTWIAGIAGFLFLVHAFTAQEPIVDLKALALRNFAIGSLQSFVIGIGIYCMVYLTPGFLARVRGFDSLQIGVAMLSVGCAQLVGLVAYTWFARFVPLRKLLVFGLILFGLGCAFYVPVTHEWGWQQLLIPQMLRGFGQQFCISPIVMMSLGSLPPERLKSASGLFNLMRNLGGAIGIAVASTMLNDRLNLHYERLAEHVTTGRPAIELALGRQMTHLSGVAGDTLNSTQGGIALLHSLMMREALTLTFSDTFLAVALCFGVALLAMLFSKPFGHSAAPKDAH